VPSDIPELGLDARFDHVAVAAPRIRDLLPVYADLLGGRAVLGGDNVRVGYRALQLTFPDDRRVELMEPLAGSRFFERFFARTGGGGMHHVTFLVPDIHRALRAVDGSKYTPTSVFLGNPDWQEAFLHPKQTSGVLIQVVQATKRDRPPRTHEDVLDDVLHGRGNAGNGQPSP
jgi:methylmalonyl-CoA/ethylmalonyl-CoA epimerase